MMILFTQSTAVLHKIFEWWTKNTLLQFFPEVAQNSQNSENSLSFPRSEKSLSIPGFQVCGHPERVCSDIKTDAKRFYQNNARHVDQNDVVGATDSGHTHAHS